MMQVTETVSVRRYNKQLVISLANILNIISLNQFQTQIVNILVIQASQM